MCTHNQRNHFKNNVDNVNTVDEFLAHEAMLTRVVSLIKCESLFHVNPRQWLYISYLLIQIKWTWQ